VKPTGSGSPNVRLVAYATLGIIQKADSYENFQSNLLD